MRNSQVHNSTYKSVKITDLWIEARHVINAFDCLKESDRFVMQFKNDDLGYHVAKACDYFKRIVFFIQNYM